MKDIDLDNCEVRLDFRSSPLSFTYFSLNFSFCLSFTHIDLLRAVQR